jgi:glycosyltransferase involved in cell wall biosynthesis
MTATPATATTPTASAAAMATTSTTAPAVRLSVIVITKNEAARLPTCLASVAFADELIVVDAFSTDSTAELARGFGARVIVTPDWPGFGLQKQRALDAATGDWVLAIDADEWLDDALADAVRQLTQAPLSSAQPAHCAVGRMSAFCGQWMRAGSWYPDVGTRLFKRGSAHYSVDRVHERLLLDGPSAKPAVLPGLLLHNSMTGLHDAVDKMNRYSSGRAADLRARGRRGGLGRAVGHGLWAFFRGYVLRRGFVDGRLGLVLAMLDGQASYFRYLKMWLADRPTPHELPHPDRR